MEDEDDDDGCVNVFAHTETLEPTSIQMRFLLSLFFFSPFHMKAPVFSFPLIF